MAEFELGLLRQRARAAFEQRVRRGITLWEVPVGFIRTEGGQIEKTTDRQVQQAIATVFQKFQQLGSARQATLWFREEQIALPHVKGGTAGKEVYWAVPSSGRVLQILKNPCYGGAFAYGKTAPRTVIEEGRARQQSRYRKPQNEWKVLLVDHHPGYSSWEEYLENQRRLEANVAWGEGESGGAAKSGTAMLSGLLRCGRCGRKLQVVYSGNGGRVPRYSCRGDRGDRGSSPCLTIGSLRVDRAVIHSVLGAIQPAAIEAAVKVSECAEAENDEKRKALELALERARYEANRARRQFDAVEPGNRLVAAELERRWEAKLQELRRAEEEQHRFQHRQGSVVLTPEIRRQLEHICQELPQLWNSGLLAVPQQKELLRCLIARVILKRMAQDMVEVKIVWISGHYTVLSARVPVLYREQVTGYANLVQRVHELMQIGHESDPEIATQLAAEGFHSARSAAVSPVLVQRIRRAHGWYYSLHQSRYRSEIAGYLTPKALAERVGVERTWVYRRLYRGEIEAKYLRRHPSSQIDLLSINSTI